MAFDRGCSILFYMLIAVLTCWMVYQMEMLPNGRLASGWTCGYRTQAAYKNRLLMTGIFVILFGVMALRFDIGNDYRQYTQTAHEAYVGGYVVTEAGFNIVVRLVYGLAGWECYEAVFALFAFFTLWFFLKALSQQSVCFAQSFFLFMTLGLYFQTFNTVRYYLALAIALFSIRYVLGKDFIKFVFWIGIAALFHKSVLLVIPIYWVAALEWKKWHILVGTLLCVVCFVAKGPLLTLALILYPSYKNTVYLEGGWSLTSVVRIAAVLGFYLWFCMYMGKEARDKSWYRELRLYGQLNLLALAASTFFSFLPVVTRIAYYFSVPQLLLIPLILRNIEDLRVQKRAQRIVGILCIGYFIVFLLQAHRDGIGLLPYRSWLFETNRYQYK